MKRMLYLIYLIGWHKYHRGPAFKGCTPASYNEWQDCELQDMLKHPEWYRPCWYYFMIKRLLPAKENRFFKEIPIEPLILEKEDWSKKEWKTIEKLFGVESAERFLVRDFTIEVFGIPKEKR
jgi:hypothetical protein